MTEGTPPVPAPPSGAPQQDGMGQGWASLGTLLAGMAVWGGVGWLIDTWLGLHVFLPVGVLVGLAASVYLVYVSSGGSSTKSPTTKSPTTPSPTTQRFRRKDPA